MLLIWFMLTIVSVITETASNTIEENRSDLSSRSISDSRSFPIKSSTTLRCTKRASCFPSDKNLSYAVNEINKVYVHLKGFRIWREKNGYRMQVKLSSYDDVIKQDDQSLCVKVSIGLDDPCYEFSIPFSVLMEHKDILLSCLRIPTLKKHYLEFFFYVYKKTDEVILIQAMNYSLSTVASGEWLGGDMFRTTYCFNEEFIYFSVNATQDFKCLFNYSVSIYKSNQSQVCSIKQSPVYRWKAESNEPYLRLNISRKLLSSDEKYCLYAIFNKNEQCGIQHLKYFYYITLFQLPLSDSDKSYACPLVHDCRAWNFTIDVITIKKNIIATVTLWPEYSSCFSSYHMYLYKFNSRTCDTDYGHRISLDPYKFEPVLKSTKIVFKNVNIGYYCIVVIPFLNGSAKYGWATDSGPIIVAETAVSNIKLYEKNKHPVFGTELVVAISFLLFFTAFALWSCSEHIKRSKTKINKVSSDEESERILPLPVDKVYLFHPHHKNSEKKDAWLEACFKDGAKFSVFTLSGLITEILENPFRTVRSMLECECSGKGSSCGSNKKFIVVISEKVLCDISNKRFIPKSLEERAFHMVLESIVSDWGKAYCHVFVVAFDGRVFQDRRFSRIAPRNVDGAYYSIPDTLISLCLKMDPSCSLQELRVWLEQHDIREIVESK